MEGDEGSSLEKLGEKTVEKLIETTNPRFFKLLKRVLLLNRVRAIELCTFLLNFSISTNYFEGFRKLMREVPSLLPEGENPYYRLEEYLFGSERLYSTILLLSMLYSSPEQLSIIKTDKKINELVAYGPLTNRFFIFNTILPDTEHLKLKELLDKVKGYNQVRALIPDLAFDPEYTPVIESEALKQMYDTTFINDYLDTKLPKSFKYIPDKQWFEKYRRASPTKKLFEIDSSLTISKFMTETLNLSGFQFLSSKRQIGDIITVFQDYFVNRIPSRKTEIKEYLLCFGELLKFAEGRLYLKVRTQKIVDILKNATSQHSCKQFFERFCMEYKNVEFQNEYVKFTGQKFIRTYNKFISYALYNVSGITYTGLLIIWRALIKYFERIQLTEEFALTKGALLEEWCYKKAVNRGFNVAKLILRNPQIRPSPIYHGMKEQTKGFPRVIEVEAQFPEDSESSFEEIDVAIKVKDTLYLFECKVRRTVRGAQDIFFQKIEEINDNLRSLNWKGMLIKKNSRKNKFSEEFLQGITRYECFQVWTGSLITGFKVLSPQGFENFLQHLKKD